MATRVLVTVAATLGLALMSATPAIAAQPFPLNYKTFSLGASDAALSGTTFGHGALTLASNGLATVPYTDPFEIGRASCRERV